MLLYCTVSTLNPIAAATQQQQAHTSPNPRSKPNGRKKNEGIGSGEPTWDRGDDLPHLQPICEEKKTQAPRSDPRWRRRDYIRWSRGARWAYIGWWSCRHCRGRGRGCGPRGCRRPTRRAAWRRCPWRRRRRGGHPRARGGRRGAGLGFRRRRRWRSETGRRGGGEIWEWAGAREYPRRRRRLTEWGRWMDGFFVWRGKGEKRFGLVDLGEIPIAKVFRWVCMVFLFPKKKIAATKGFYVGFVWFFYWDYLKTTVRFFYEKLSNLTII